MANRKITVQEKRERRNALLEIMFESEFRKDESPEEIYLISSEERELSQDTRNYVKNMYFDLVDKLEIIDISTKIGTFDISIEPYEDCCTVFTPKHPRTKPQLEKVLVEERKLDFEALAQEAIDGAYTIRAEAY